MHLFRFALGVLVVAAVALVCVAATEDATKETNPKLFDFARYKELFSKRYSGLSEELVRQKYYFSRAFRAFIAGVKYKYRKLRYYLAVNYMSDRSPAELDKMRNKVQERQLVATPEGAGRVARKRQSEAELSDDVTFEQAPDSIDRLEELAAEHAGEPVFKELKEVLEGHEKGAARRKRSVKKVELRELPLDKLINTGAQAHLEAGAAAKLARRVPSDNAYYKRPEIESYGLREEDQEGISWHVVKPRFPELRKAISENVPDIKFGSFDPLDYLVKGISYLANLEPYDVDHDDSDNEEEFHDALSDAPEAAAPVEGVLEDKVWIDLRSTNCFHLPRKQGECGSCYAFAVNAIMEWLYCMKTGKLVAFSEQYMVDCGHDYVQGLDGCDGGSADKAGRFVHNFGLELRANYPYRQELGSCPYEPDDDLKTTGYIRNELGHIAAVDETYWPDALKESPMYVSISLGPGFAEYGGGVHGHGCNQTSSSHAVVLIGHGREDGAEYWLIRNSHSVGWGEGGYYKLAKDAGCAVYKSAYMFGSTDGKRIPVRPVRNLRYNYQRIKKLYEDSVLT